MLTAEGCAARRKRLWDALPTPCDALILGDPQSLIYFANYYPSPFLFRVSDASAVLILEPDRATLVADSMLKPFLDKAIKALRANGTIDRLQKKWLPFTKVPILK